MILALPAMLTLAQQCAPGIAPEAIVSIASVESHFDPFAINVNHVGRMHAASAADAIATATRYIKAGYSVDLGLAQINSRNLGWLGLSIAAAFEPCANLGAAQQVLSIGFAKASREATGLEAISRTFSLYNTGNMTAGFRNNYVARVWREAEQLLPQMQGSVAPSPPAPFAAASTSSPSPRPASSFVIDAGDSSVLVFK